MPRNTRVPAGQMLATTSLPLSPAGAAPATAASVPPLRLVAARSSVMVQRSTPDELVPLRAGVNLVAGDRPLEIRVNGAVVNSSFAFPATGSGSTWQTVSLTANLNAGNNTVRATSIGSGGPNLDNLVVQ